MAAPYRACIRSAHVLMAAPYRACIRSAHVLMAAPYRACIRSAHEANPLEYFQRFSWFPAPSIKFGHAVLDAARSWKQLDRAFHNCFRLIHQLSIEQDGTHG